MLTNSTNNFARHSGQSPQDQSAGSKVKIRLVKKRAILGRCSLVFTKRERPCWSCRSLVLPVVGLAGRAMLPAVVADNGYKRAKRVRNFYLENLSVRSLPRLLRQFLTEEAAIQRDTPVCNRVIRITLRQRVGTPAHLLAFFPML